MDKLCYGCFDCFQFQFLKVNLYYLGTILENRATLQTMKQCLTGLAAGCTKSFNTSSLSKSHPGYDDNQNHSAANVVENQKINRRKKWSYCFFFLLLLVLCCHGYICHRNMSENSVNWYIHISVTPRPTMFLITSLCSIHWSCKHRINVGEAIKVWKYFSDLVLKYA